MLYQVELAVCYEDGTWELENVQVAVSGKEPSNGKIWEAAVDGAYKELVPDGAAVVAIGLYHVQKADANE